MSRPLQILDESVARIRDGLCGLLLAVNLTAGCTDLSCANPESTPVRDSELQVNSTDVANPLDEPYQIEVTGHEYRWHVRYPSSSGQLETDQDSVSLRDIHVPLDADIVFVLKSKDYVYVLELPEFGKKEIAVPSLEFQMQFRPEKAGRYPLLGDELCGDPHPELKGTLVVESQAQFLDWLQGQASATAAERTF